MKLFVLILVLSFSHLIQAQIWVQKGSTINGDEDGDGFGSAAALSTDGLTFVASAPSTSYSSEPGYVKVFEWDGSDWAQKGSTIESTDFTELLGFSVSINGDGSVIAVGMPGICTVRVYEWNGSNWEQKGNSFNNVEALPCVGDIGFGQVVSLDLSGDYIVVDCSDNSGSYYQQTSFWQYESGMDTWIRMGDYILSDNPGDQFGRRNTVNIIESAMLFTVGSPGYDNTEDNAGKAQSYIFDGSNWVQHNNKVEGDMSDCEFGCAVSMSSTGSIVAVGGWGNHNIGLPNTGIVKIFESSGSEYNLKGNPIYGFGGSGYAVELDQNGNTVVFSSTRPCAPSDVRTYTWNGSDWEQLGQILTAPYEESSSLEVDISYDGETVLIGDTYMGSTGINTGYVKIYELSETPPGSTLINTCNSYTVPSGDTTYISSGVYTDTIPATMGGDSIITIYLTITTPYTVAEVIGSTIHAHAFEAEFQWLDCDNNFEIIPGETNSVFTPTGNGLYAVEVTQFGCVDTSVCHVINTISIDEKANPDISVFPNPTIGKVLLSEAKNIQKIEIYSSNGSKCIEIELPNKEIDISNLKDGIYLVKVYTENGVKTEKLVISR